MNFDEVAVFRFLPDLAEDNPFGFVVDNVYHELMINGKKKRVACLKMYDGPDAACPCCQTSQKYYNELGDEKMGKLFWRKIDYVAQGVIVSSPFDYPIKAEENPVRMISLGPKLFKKIEAAIMSGDFDIPPYDLTAGYDFRIMKTRQGEYAAYDNSEFTRKASAVSDAFLEKIQLYDLKNFRYGRIDPLQMETMIEAALTGKSYDEKKKDDGEPAATVAEQVAEGKEQQPLETAAAATAEAAAPAAAATPPAGGSSRAQEILARLRNRNAA
jgi:hypothetical protein